MQRRAFLSSIAFLLSAAVYLKYTSSNLADPDLWGYLAFGRLFWSGEFPYQDVFAYVPTLDRWIYHEWLTGVLFYPIFQCSRETAMQLLMFGCIAATAWLAYATARVRKAPTWASWLILYAVAYNVGFGYSPVRAQVFTFLFFSLFLWIMESARQKDRYLRLAWLPLVMVFWANLHGGFVAGLLAIGLYAAGELLSGRRSLPFFVAATASALATLINPYGLEYWIYMLEALAMPRPEIEEWWSVFKSLYYGKSVLNMWLFLGFAFLGALLVLWNRARDRSAALILAATGFMAASHLRHIVFYCLALAALGPLFLGQAWEALRSQTWFGRKCGAVALVLAGLVVLMPLRTFDEYFRAFFVDNSPLNLKAMTHKEVQGWPIYYPVEAVDYIKKQELTGNLLPQFFWGEYCIWELFPQCRVSMDGRYETVYPPEVHEAYFEFLNGGPGWRDFLDAWPHDMILLKPNYRAAGLVAQLPEWRKAYEDSGSVLFVRSGD